MLFQVIKHRSLLIPEKALHTTPRGTPGEKKKLTAGIR